MRGTFSDYLADGIVFVIWNATRIFVGTCAAIALGMFVWWVWR